MRMQKGFAYNGIRMYDNNKDVIADETWYSQLTDRWTELQEIPQRSHIIGLKCDTVSREDFVINLSFILGSIDQPEITGYLRFPQV